MKFKLKKFLSVLLAISLIFVFPFTVDAKQGTLGTENPSLQASFVNSTGDMVDGNNLTAGSYTVSINLYGMECVSIFNLVATYTDDIVVNSVSTAADSVDGFVNGAANYGDGKVVAILASSNDDTTAISSGTTMVTLAVTIVADDTVDFADCFKIDYDTQSTFIEADYGDGFESAYVMVGNDPTDDEYPLITEDMSPDLSKLLYSVTGKVTIAENTTGSVGKFGVGGITVKALSGETVVAQAETEADGSYVLEGLVQGEYTLALSGPTTIDRTVSLVVSAEKADSNNCISVNSTPIVICDYNKDGIVNMTDVAAFTKYLNGNYYLYADFNADTTINTTDVKAFVAFIDKTVEYNEVTL